MSVALAIDIGSTRMKYACITANGDLVGDGTAPINYATLQTEGDVGVLEGIERIPAEIKKQIRAITVSGQGPSLIPLDRSNRVVRPPLARHQLERGRGGGGGQYLPFALEYLRRYPGVASQVWRWVGVPEYIVMLLCGRWAAMLPSPRYRRYYWSASELRRSGLLPRQFPPAVYIGEVLGGVRAAVAERCGLPGHGVVVISAGLDFYAAMIGAQTMQRGTVCDRAGSTEGVNIIGEARRRHPLLRSYPLFTRGVRNQSLLILNSGALLEGGDREEIVRLRAFIATAAASPPDALPPSFLPRVFRRGVVEMPRAASHSTAALPAPILRLLCLEALLFTIRYTLELFPAPRRERMTMALCGGQAHVPGWAGMKADFLGMAVRQFQCAHTELLGGAAIAFTTLGVYRDLREATRHISRATLLTPASIEKRRELIDTPRYKGFAKEMDVMYKTV